MLKIAETNNLNDIYNFQLGFEVPYFFSVDFEYWKKSFTEDIDGEGRRLFKELNTKVVYDNDKLVGFIQYGKTAFGFAENGEISSDISYPVIRNLYFNKDRIDAGKLLLNDALENLGNNERVYAFFHYFGMSCFARHGKLFDNYTYIEALLKENDFEVEHENVYYSSTLNGEEKSDIVVTPHDLTKGNQQYIDFILEGSQVGGCEVHYLNENIAYLRWIYVNGEITGKGIGTKCMKALKSFLYEKGFTRFDTDTAVNNTVAQHYYEKTGFKREGITKSYYCN
ncbi:MAG: GNAT family N-acetyltransferase [Acutalibacteraceae bacterium]|nr:GNAT family N-acetyltransferase [Acutalibacteraceae bacterium]